MVRLKCKKCGNVYEQSIGAAVLAVHIGPLHYMKCPACGKSSWFNIYHSVKDSVTWPEPEKAEDQNAAQLSDEELERKRIEDSKYEKP
jgi:hypothetical protein